MTLASFLSWADRSESYLIENPKDRFSRDEARTVKIVNIGTPEIIAVNILIFEQGGFRCTQKMLKELQTV